jgi:hypothetical protein
MVFNVLWIWFTLIHLFRTDYHPQVVQGVDGFEVVVQTTKQSSFDVTLLIANLLREHTFQEIIGLHFNY